MKNMSVKSSQPTLLFVQNLENTICTWRDEVLNPHPQCLLGVAYHCLALHSQPFEKPPRHPTHLFKVVLFSGSVDTPTSVKLSGADKHARG